MFQDLVLEVKEKRGENEGGVGLETNKNLLIFLWTEFIDIINCESPAKTCPSLLIAGI